jgi:hypothetical protein
VDIPKPVTARLANLIAQRIGGAVTLPEVNLSARRTVLPIGRGRRQSLYDKPNPCYLCFCSADPGSSARRPAAVEQEDETADVTFGIQCVARKDFFIWIRCNPLISPDSAKEIQGNPSFFLWFFLNFLWIYLVRLRRRYVAVYYT